MLRVIRLYLVKKIHRDYKLGLSSSLEILRSYCGFSTHLQRFFFPSMPCPHLTPSRSAFIWVDCQELSYFQNLPCGPQCAARLRAAALYQATVGIKVSPAGVLGPSRHQFCTERGSQVTEPLKAPCNCSALS